jgi:hypothetical protein
MKKILIKERKRFGPQGHRLLCTPQTRIAQIEPEGAKVPLHWSSLPRGGLQRPGVRGCRGWRGV